MHSREDDEGASIDDVSFTLYNVPPVAAPDVGRFTGGPITIPALANDTDADDHVLTIDSATQGAHGTTSIQNGAIVYTPGPTFFGSDEFTYQISDELGATATGIATIRTAVPISIALSQTKSPMPGAGEPIGVPADAVVAKLGIPTINGEGEPQAGGPTVLGRSARRRS